MQRLERQYGLRTVVLQWFSSYLSGRTFQPFMGRYVTNRLQVMGIGRNGATLGMLGMLIKDVMAPRAINYFLTGALS